MGPPDVPPQLPPTACMELSIARHAYGYEVGRFYKPGRLLAFRCANGAPAGLFAWHPVHGWTHIVPLRQVEVDP